MKSIARFAVLCAAIALVAGGASATTFTWIGGTSGNWSDQTNWDSDDGTPGDDGYPDNAADIADIPKDASDTTTVTVDVDVDLLELRLTGGANKGTDIVGTKTITIADGGHVEWTQWSNLCSANLSFAGEGKFVHKGGRDLTLQGTVTAEVIRYNVTDNITSERGLISSTNFAWSYPSGVTSGELIVDARTTASGDTAFFKNEKQDSIPDTVDIYLHTGRFQMKNSDNVQGVYGNGTFDKPWNGSAGIGYTGSHTGHLILDGGGVIDPGTYTGDTETGAGTLAFDADDDTMELKGGTLIIDIYSAASADKMTFGGSRSGTYCDLEFVGGTDLEIALNSYSPSNGDSWTIIELADDNNTITDFATNGFNAITGDSPGGGLSWNVKQVGNDIVLEVVPEPASAFLVGLGGVLLAIRRKRR
jgi:hypothetical protein